eukprot:1192575-Prorocentrum_minimum.AAC.1
MCSACATVCAVSSLANSTSTEPNPSTFCRSPQTLGSAFLSRSHPPRSSSSPPASSPPPAVSVDPLAPPPACAPPAGIASAVAAFSAPSSPPLPFSPSAASAWAAEASAASASAAAVSLGGGIARSGVEGLGGRAGSMAGSMA